MKQELGRPLALVIIDGWGNTNAEEDTIFSLAHTPYYDEICRTFPMTSLVASGPRVGLPDGAAGNPEAGHLNIGAGRVMQTDGTRIAEAIRIGEFFENGTLKTAMQEARSRGSVVHFAGLLSDAGVHSSTENLFALLRFAKQEQLPQVFIHCFLDGRDVPAKTADAYVEALEVKMAEIGIGRIASLCGRSFAMDSEDNWERTARAYTMLVHSEGEGSPEAKTAIRNSFLRGYSDDYISPILIEGRPGIPVATVKEGDLVVFFNHRADGMRQLVSSMAAAVESNGMSFNKPKIEIVCLSEYDPVLALQVAFRPVANEDFIGDVVTKNGLPDFRITESERSAHLCQIFDGRAGLRSPDSQRIVLNSPDIPSRRSKPEMCSFKITDKLIRGLESGQGGVFFVNIPAVALIAETGDRRNTIEAVQFVDTCLGGILEKVRAVGAIAVITSSFSNCDEMVYNSNNRIRNSITTNTVPFHIVDEGSFGTDLREGGSLEDIAPTILGILGIEKPSEMTGDDLRNI